MAFPVCMHFFKPYTGCCGKDDFEKEVLCVREIGTHNMPATKGYIFYTFFFFIMFLCFNYFHFMKLYHTEKVHTAP